MTKILHFPACLPLHVLKRLLRYHLGLPDLLLLDAKFLVGIPEGGDGDLHRRIFRIKERRALPERLALGLL